MSGSQLTDEQKRENHRLAQQKYRAKLKENAEHEAALDRSRKTLKMKQEDRERDESSAKERKSAADNGDAFSRMMLADRFSEEYWTAFQQMEQEFASASGKVSSCEVNGISVNDDQFPLKVMLTIEELGSIKTDLG